MVFAKVGWQTVVSKDSKEVLDELARKVLSKSKSKHTEWQTVQRTQLL